MKKWIALFIVLLVIAGGAFAVYRYYEYIFAKTVTGKITKVEKMSAPQASPLPDGSSAQSQSFVIAIKDNQGVIHTSSTEDQQWAVAQEGQCAQVKFYPFPPWQLDRSGTFHGARIMELRDCGSPSPKPSP